MAIISLIIGIIVFLNALSTYTPLIPNYPLFLPGFVSIAISVVGLILGILAVIRNRRSRIAIAGIVLNALPFLFALIFLIGLGLG